MAPRVHNAARWCGGVAARGARAATAPDAASWNPDALSGKRRGTASPLSCFRQELTKLGWSEGSDVQFDVRWTTDNMGLVRTAATDLVQLKPDVIVTVGDRIIPVLTQLTRSIPIVAVASDFLGSGFVESLARPGGNVTGFSLIEFSVIGKVVETLKQMAPGISRVGIIYNPDNPVGAIYLNSFKADAAQLAVQPIDLPVHGPAEIERAIARLAEQPNGGFITPPDLTIAALATEIPPLRPVTGFPQSTQVVLFT